MYMNGYWLETADVSQTFDPIELFGGDDTFNAYVEKHPQSMEVAKAAYQTMVTAPDWIPFAAEAYHTSNKVSDYFIIPTIIMPSDLPNRNAAAFPLAELTKFSPDIGDLAYRGWKGKPVHVEHINQDPTKAIGAVVDVSMRPLKNTSMWKVITLLAVDRTKNVPITSAILRGERKHYSMGAMVKGHTCSVCGARGDIQKGHRTRYDGLACGTQHAALERNGQFKVFDTAKGGKTLGFLNVYDIKPFEVSSVSVPAYVSADSSISPIRSL